MDLNFDQLHLFVEGMKNSRVQEAEENNSYEYGLNGRLYSKDGKLAYSSIQGTVSIYNNDKIVKYLGYYAFADALIIFVKYNQKGAGLGTTNVVSEVILGGNVTINIPFGQTQHNFTNELSVNGTEETTTIAVVDTPEPEQPLLDSYDVLESIQTLDLSEYYRLSGQSIIGYEQCDIGGLNQVPEYNKEYADAIIVLTNNGYHAFNDWLAWVGNMNWDINRKITTAGIDENAYYKRIYFTDNLNPFRVLNLRDDRLWYRTAEEFSVSQDATLLQPRIKEIKDGGSIKAMSVQYAYILITDNGQVTSFSPYSPITYILKDDNGADFEGGDIGEQTSKMVVIQCPIVSLLFKEIQCIAIEYEADTIPTAIRNLGKKDVSGIVEFVHTGNEQEFDTSFTIEDIIETRHIWTYCNDITTKNNKLIAAGLRNKPYAVQEKYVEDLFLLKGWSVAGVTHNSLINPTPSLYKYFDPLNTEPWVYVKKQLYKRFLFFGNATLTLNNRNNPNEKRSISFESSSDQYIDYIDQIAEWAIAIDLVGFDNLKIRRSDNNILFYPENDLLQTDMSDYYFTTSISQVIIDFENEYGILTPTVNNVQLIYGAQSVGFNKGTGVRISWEEKKEPVMDKAPEIYNGGPVLNLLTPTLKKTFVKGEIYRLSIQFFKSGSPLFAIVLGDVQTPEIGDIPKFIDNDGNIAIGEELYANQSVENNQLMAHRLEMRVEVRVPCQFKDYVDSYQIQYVERTENNRTILAQGISAPAIRLNKFTPSSKSGSAYAANVFDKWTLPFNGGPLYSVNGLIAYDEQGENYETDLRVEWGYSDTIKKASVFNREIVHRKMFYFDSPDLIYGRVSDVNIANATAKVIGRVNTDHTQNMIRDRVPEDKIHENYFLTEAEFISILTGQATTYVGYKTASFSRKIGFKNLAGTEDAKPYYSNISVFSEFTHLNISSPISKSSKLLTKGQLIPSLVLGTNYEFSNNALTLFAQHAYNSSLWLGAIYIQQDGLFQREGDIYASETAQSANASPGYSTVILRTDDNIFTDEFIGNHRQNPIISAPHTNDGTAILVDINKNFVKTGVPNTDAHAIINLKMNNENSVYGGRGKYAYSKNVFMPLGKVIPMEGSQGDTQSQIFNCEGDFFTSLFLRTKNDFSEMRELEQTTMHQRIELKAKNSITDYNRGNGWAYAVILETEIESRLTDQYRFYKSDGAIDFSVDIQETINSAYFKKDNLRIYSPVPYNFKDDPLMINMLSASKTKLSGDYIDAWTTFILNEFYELEKSKGIITNITNWEDQLLAIQERETSQVNIDTTDFVTTQGGEEVAIKKGDGRTFTSHKKLSDFGTSIRRALAQGEFGICFVDEYNKAFVKFGESLSLPLEIQMKLRELFEYNKIIDTEGYYDVKYKETNIRVRTEQGITYMLSYNELLQKFNGWIAYDNDIYMMYDKRVFAPTCHAVNITVTCAQITSPLTANYQIGSYFEYQISATNNPVFYNAIDLPSGLTINKSTGLISGYLNTAGVYLITIYADNDVCGDTVTLTVDAVDADLSNKPDNNGIPNITADGTATVTGTLTAWFNAPLEGVSNGSTTLFAPSLTGTNVTSGTSNGSSSTNGKMGDNIYGVSNSFSQPLGIVKQPMYFDNYITSLEGTPDCKLVVYGEFDNYNLEPAKRLAKIELSGLQNQEFKTNIGTSTPVTVYSHTGAWVDPYGYVHVTGVYNTFNGLTANHYIKLNSNGTKNTQMVLGTGFSWFTTMAYVGESEKAIYVPGIFTTWKGSSAVQLAKLTPDGDKAFGFNSGSGGGTTAIQVLNWDESNILVHGYFGSWNGVARNHLVVLNKQSGTINYSFNTGVGPSPAWNEKPMKGVMDTLNGNKLLITGMFTSWHGVSRNYIARINRDGSLDETYNVGTGFNNTYQSVTENIEHHLVAVYYDKDYGKLVVGGIFNTYNGISVPPLVRLNSDGSLDNTFNYNLPDFGTVVGITKIGDYYFAGVTLQNNVVPSSRVYLVKIDALTGDAHTLMNLENDQTTPCSGRVPAYSNAGASLIGIMKGYGALSGVSNTSMTVVGVMRRKGLILATIEDNATVTGVIKGKGRILGVASGSATTVSVLTGRAIGILSANITGSSMPLGTITVVAYVAQIIATANGTADNVSVYQPISDVNIDFASYNTNTTSPTLPRYGTLENVDGKKVLAIEFYVTRYGSPDHDIYCFVASRNNGNHLPAHKILESPTVYQASNISSYDSVWLKFELPEWSFDVSQVVLNQVWYFIGFDRNVVLRNTSNYMRVYYKTPGNMVDTYYVDALSQYSSYSALMNGHMAIKLHTLEHNQPRLLGIGNNNGELVGASNSTTVHNFSFIDAETIPYHHPMWRRSSIYPTETMFGTGGVFGYYSDSSKLAITTVRVWLKKFGIPDFNVKCRLYKVVVTVGYQIVEIYEESITVIHSSTITEGWYEFSFIGKAYDKPCFMIFFDNIVTKNSTNFIGVAAIDNYFIDDGAVPITGINKWDINPLVMTNSTTIGQTNNGCFFDIDYHTAAKGTLTILPVPVKTIWLSTISTSATWSPPNITNTVGTLTWDVTGDITPTSQNVNDPTFNLSANTGTVNMAAYDVSNLIQLTLNSLNLSMLNVSENDALLELLCYSNSLTTLDVTANTAMTNLWCHSNLLTTLDISQNINLDQLFCYSNSLITLDISTNTELGILYCQFNNFSETVTNSILASLVSHGLTGGILRYRNNETGQGVTDRATLVSRGWIITNYAT